MGRLWSGGRVVIGGRVGGLGDLCEVCLEDVQSGLEDFDCAEFRVEVRDHLNMPVSPICLFKG